MVHKKQKKVPLRRVHARPACNNKYWVEIEILISISLVTS